MIREMDSRRVGDVDGVPVEDVQHGRVGGDEADARTLEEEGEVGGAGPGNSTLIAFQIIKS